MHINKLSILVLFLCFFSRGLFAQGKINASKVKQFIVEANTDCSEYQSDEVDAIYKEWLSRIRIAKLNKLGYDEMPQDVKSISNYQGRNKCYAGYDYNTSVKELNPLMFHLHFETDNPVLYRIDDTDYFLLILPKP